MRDWSTILPCKSWYNYLIKFSMHRKMYWGGKSRVSHCLFSGLLYNMIGSLFTFHYVSFCHMELLSANKGRIYTFLIRPQSVAYAVLGFDSFSTQLLPIVEHATQNIFQRWHAHTLIQQKLKNCLEVLGVSLYILSVTTRAAFASFCFLWRPDSTKHVCMWHLLGGWHDFNIVMLNIAYSKLDGMWCI